MDPATAAAGKAAAWAWNEFGEGFKAWTGALIKSKYKEKKEQSDRLQEFEKRWADLL